MNQLILSVFWIHRGIWNVKSRGLCKLLVEDSNFSGQLVKPEWDKLQWAAYSLQYTAKTRSKLLPNVESGVFIALSTALSSFSTKMVSKLYFNRNANGVNYNPKSFLPQQCLPSRGRSQRPLELNFLFSAFFLIPVLKPLINMCQVRTKLELNNKSVKK